MKTRLKMLLGTAQRGLTLAVALALSNTVASAQMARLSEIVSLGDSLSDVGRFYAATGNSLPPAPYFNGRFSNGPVWTEHLATLLGKPLDPASQFAIGGAMTNSDNFRSMAPNFVLPGFQQQVTQVLNKNGHRRVDPRAIYTVWIGANDFFAWLSSGNPDPSATIQEGVANTINGISDLAEAGAAHVVVLNLPDLGKTPAARALPPGVDGLLSILSVNYNALLDHQLDQLEEDKKITIVRINAFELINHMIANPSDYGLTNVTDMAIAGDPAVDPDQFLFWDSVHPTTAAQQVVAETVYAGICQAFPGENKPHHNHQFRSKPVKRALCSGRPE